MHNFIGYIVVIFSRMPLIYVYLGWSFPHFPLLKIDQALIALARLSLCLRLTRSVEVHLNCTRGGGRQLLLLLRDPQPDTLAGSFIQNRKQSTSCCFFPLFLFSLFHLLLSSFLLSSSYSTYLYSEQKTLKSHAPRYRHLSFQHIIIFLLLLLLFLLFILPVASIWLEIWGSLLVGHLISVGRTVRSKTMTW